MLRSAYAVALTISANPWQPPPVDVPTSADLVLWRDTFGAGVTTRFAIVRETIRPDNLKARLRPSLNSTSLTRDEKALIERLLQRNATVIPLPPSLAESLGALLVDPASILLQSNDRRDYDAIFRQSRQLGRELAWLSLPAFSDDGQLAAVYIEWTSGFDSSGGEGAFIERRNGRWVQTGVFDVCFT
jgi:hypothetical protein